MTDRQAWQAWETELWLEMILYEFCYANRVNEFLEREP